MSKIISGLLIAVLMCGSLEAATAKAPATTRKPIAATTRRAPPTKKPAIVPSPKDRGVVPRPLGHATDGPCKANPSATWFDGCNWCTCQKEGPLACTLMYCADNYRVLPGCLRGKKSGDFWFAGCNMFTCSALPNGTLVTQRTLKGKCWTAPQATKVPLARTTKKPAAKPNAAGKMAPTAAATPVGPCVKSDSWFDGCNQCQCLKGEPTACTRKYCANNTRTVAGCPEGKGPGQTWYADCNSHMCQRLQNGTLVTQQTVNGQCW